MRRAQGQVPNAVRGSLETLGQRLRDVRQHRGVSIRQISKLTDDMVSGAAVSRIETGERFPNAGTLLALALALDVDFKLTRLGTIEIQGTGLAGVGSGRTNREETK